MEYCSAIEKNEIMPFEASWMELEIITLNEGSQTEKDKYDIMHMWNLKKNTIEVFYKTEIDSQT